MVRPYIDSPRKIDVFLSEPTLQVVQLVSILKGDQPNQQDYPHLYAL